MNRTLMMAAILGMANISANRPLVRYPSAPREPRTQFTDAELETLAAFPDTKAGRRAKKNYVRELRTKYSTGIQNQPKEG